MPHRRTTVPPDQTLPARAGQKLAAAQRREADAARLRAEAEELQQLWREYKQSVVG